MTPTVTILLANAYTLAALALIALRAAPWGHPRIPWPWWAVTAPLWGLFAAALVVSIVLGLYVACERLVERLQEWEPLP